MIFSNDEVVRFLSERFECAWESVRPVPKVEIDFGTGHRLSRTLNGNIATYFCLPDGRAFDLLPGLVTPEEFLARARLASSFHQRLKRLPSTLTVKSYHRQMKDLDSPDAEKVRADSIAAGQQMETKERSYGVSKAGVEVGLKKSLLASMLKEAYAKPIADQRKDEVESPLKSLMDDTRYNRSVRYPKAHDLLAQAPLSKPSDLTRRVYKEVLDVDLDDPWLGLAPYVLGGEGGRHHD